MKIKSTTLKGFRAFSRSEGSEVPLGEVLTVIAGLNGTGKSTILAVLGNCGRLEKSKATHLNGDQFTTELSEVLKFDVKHDSAGSSVSIEFADDANGFAENVPPDGVLEFRSAIQQNNTPKVKNGVQVDRLNDPRSRLRLIPSKKNRPVESEAKLQWPTYYLGLSRLFPVGETDEYSARSKQWDFEIRQEYESTYNYILNLSDPIEAFGLITSSSARNKKGSGIETENYGFVANSAGQDNLGQIVLSALSFKHLRKTLGTDYRGGLLLIDEVEATLHPVAQTRLLNFLYRTAFENEFQVVLTTHSLTILEEICSRLHPEDTTRTLVNLKRTGEILEVEVNPAFAEIEADMNSQFLAGARTEFPKVFLEDGAARQVFDCIHQLRFPDLQVEVVEGDLSWNQLLAMANEFSAMLASSLIILDPDIRSHPRHDVEKRIPKSIFRFPGEAALRPGERTLMFLPGSSLIEEMMYTFYKEAGATADVYHHSSVKALRVDYHSLMNIDNGPTDGGSKKLSKWWFSQIPHPVVPELVTYWLEKGDLDLDSFETEFRRNYDIARKFV